MTYTLEEVSPATPHSEDSQPLPGAHESDRRNRILGDRFGTEEIASSQMETSCTGQRDALRNAERWRVSGEVEIFDTGVQKLPFKNCDPPGVQNRCPSRNSVSVPFRAEAGALAELPHERRHHPGATGENGYGIDP